MSLQTSGNVILGILIMYQTIKCILPQKLCEMQLSYENQDLYVCSNLDCIESDCNYSCEPHNRNNSPVSMRLVDEYAGRLEVTFKLHNLKLKRYLIELEADETTGTAEECGAISSQHSSFLPHTSKEVEFEWCEDQSCAEDCKDEITVMFDYVYTACYRVTIWRYNQSATERSPITSCSEMIQTKFLKKSFTETEMKPIVGAMHRSNSATLTVHTQGHPEIIWIVLNLSSESKKSRSLDICDRGLVSHICCVYDRVNNNRTIMCEDAENSTVTTCSLTETEFGKEVVQCDFFKVKHSNYCISIKYDDARCRQGTVWGDDQLCHWILPMDPPPPPKDEPVDAANNEKHNAPLIVFLFAVTMMFISVTCFIVFYWHKHYFKPPIIKRINGWSPRLAENIGLCKLGNPKIFLHYPRDCDRFMEVMAKFREVLRRANCEVFDIWDPEQYNIVSSCPNSFIQLMTEKSIQVIVCATDCSRLLEKNVLGSTSASYRTPHCFDDLFLYGLQCLNQTNIGDCYERTYVVSLQGRQSNNEAYGLAYLNPLTIFLLPIHLERLMLALHGVDGSNYSLVISIPEVVEFKEAIDNYNSFKLSNPNYLDNMISAINTDNIILDLGT